MARLTDSEIRDLARGIAETADDRDEIYEKYRTAAKGVTPDGRTVTSWSDMGVSASYTREYSAADACRIFRTALEYYDNPGSDRTPARTFFTA